MDDFTIYPLACTIGVGEESGVGMLVENLFDVCGRNMSIRRQQRKRKEVCFDVAGGKLGMSETKMCK